MVVHTGYTCARKFLEYLFYFCGQEKEAFSEMMERRVHYCTITPSVTAFAHITTCSVLLLPSLFRAHLHPHMRAHSLCIGLSTLPCRGANETNMHRNALST
jgi:hypothetical protein